MVCKGFWETLFVKILIILRERDMAYKIDGAKFSSIEEMKESLWPLYEGKMSKQEFDKYVETNAETI